MVRNFRGWTLEIDKRSDNLKGFNILPKRWILEQTFGWLNASLDFEDGFLDNIVTLTLRNKVTEHKQTIYSETLEKIESEWKTLNKSQRKIIELLFEHQEMRIFDFRHYLALTEKAIRNNLLSLTQLNIVEKLSEKTRDSNALYRLAMLKNRQWESTDALLTQN